jgi:hypothetical protein
MRHLAIASIALALVAGTGTPTIAQQDECMIGDAALCLANPNCHWDGGRRGCYPGPAEHGDACAAHEDQGICDSDTTLGCKWSAEKSQCGSKAAD